MVRVAIDVGPTHGPRTGVPAAVAGTIDALQRGPASRADLELLPYVVSMRAKLTPPERRLPLPAALALRYWAQGGRPIDARLGSPDVVHGTNYVVPPSRAARLVSVYDCWFLEHPELAAPDVRRSGAVLRRAVADGAAVVTSSRATTARVRQLLNKDELPVIIQADSNADHGVFSDVWSEVKNAGAKKISLSTRND